MKGDLWDVAVAALLHDIGKVIQRSKEGSNKKHEVYSKEAINTILGEIGVALNFNIPLIEELVYFHHKKDENPSVASNALINIIRIADHISSTERMKEEDKTLYKPLASVFQEVFMKKEEEKKKRHFFELDRIPSKLVNNNGELTISPRENVNVSSYNYASLYNAFLKEWRTLMNSAKLIDKKQVFELLVTLLKKYFFFVPSAAYETVPDISLYSHLKTTAGIAIALYKYYEYVGGTLTENVIKNSKPFLVILGDFSGIQNFIYTLTTSGALKSSKGRSLYLEFLEDAIVTLLLTDLELTSANVLYLTGGSFVILAPNIDRIKQKITQIRVKVNKFLWDTFQGDLYLALGCTESSPDDLADHYGRLRFSLQKTIDEMKNSKFKELGINWFNNLFKPTIVPEGAEECEVCKRVSTKIIPDEDGTRKCEVCRFMESLGAYLRNTQLIVKLIHPCHLKPVSWDIGEFLEFPQLGVAYIVFRKNELKEKSMVYTKTDLIVNHDDFLSKNKENIRYTLLLANSNEFTQETIIEAMHQLVAVVQEFYIGTHAPTKEDNSTIVKSMEEIVENSLGDKKMAILKMDVDNLGSIMAVGFDKTKRSPARLSTLSELLNIFFKGYINELISEYGMYPSSVYLIYSGGDDLLLAGAWDKVYDLAKKINLAFRGLVINEKITLSAGYYIGPPKMPFYQSVGLANIALEEFAKSGDKGRISFIGEKLSFEAIRWKTLDLLDELYSQLLDLLKERDPPVSRALLFKLQQIVELAKRDETSTIGIIRAKYITRYVINRFKKSHLKYKNELQKLGELFFQSFTLSWPALRLAEIATR